MHTRTQENIDKYNQWSEMVKQHNVTQYLIDNFILLLDKHEPMYTITTWVTDIDISITIDHVKEIPDILRSAIRIFGKISFREVIPDEKVFNYSFSQHKIVIKFFLSGASCELVEIGSETILKKKYKLVCANGSEEEITPESIEVE